MSAGGGTARAALAGAWTGATGAARSLAARARRGLAGGASLAARAVRRVLAAPALLRAARRADAAAATLARVALLGGATAGILLLAAWLGVRRVPAATLGVRQPLWGGGIVERDFEPGLHFGLRGLETWHLLDRRTHFASFGAAEQGAENPPLDLRTKEGNELLVGVLVPYRIVPGEAHALVRDGLRGTYAALATATIQDVLMQDLATLTAEDFARTEMRTSRAEASLPRLNELLARYHVRAESIQIHQVDFRPAYEQILQKKQLTKQLALLAKAGTLVEHEMRANQLEQDGAAAEVRIRGEKDKELETARSAAKQELSRIRGAARELDFRVRSQAQAEADRLLLEGDRALDAAQGLKESLTRAAYDSPGGRIELAIRQAANLRFGEVVLDANDPRTPLLIDAARWTAFLQGKSAP